MLELGDKGDQLIKAVGFLIFSLLSIKRTNESHGFHTDQVPGDNFPYIVMTGCPERSDSKHLRHLL